MVDDDVAAMFCKKHFFQTVHVHVCHNIVLLLFRKKTKNKSTNQNPEDIKVKQTRTRAHTNLKDVCLDTDEKHEYTGQSNAKRNWYFSRTETFGIRKKRDPLSNEIPFSAMF